MNTDLQYCVAFTRIPSLGPARFQLLQQHFSTLERAWNAFAAEIKGMIRQVGAMNHVRIREAPAGYGGGA